MVGLLGNFEFFVFGKSGPNCFRYGCFLDVHLLDLAFSLYDPNFKGMRINLSEWRSHSAAHQIIACVAFTYIFGSIF